MSASLADDFSDALILAMTFDVDKESVIPVNFAARTFFDVSQIDGISLKNSQYIGQ